MNPASNEAHSTSSLLSLTPELLREEELDSYNQQFQHVFTNNQLRNIAVTGAPGSGKTTIVNSWKETHPDHTWLNISLGSFSSAHVKPTLHASEEALINQIVGKMDLRRAPKTRFRKSMERPWTQDLSYAFAGAAFVALSFYLIWILSLLPSSRPNIIFNILAILAWFACIVFGTYRILRTGAISRLVKHFHSSNQIIEFTDTEENSPLLQYLNDLVYLLNTSSYDTIIFDDFNSADSIEIIQHLRQLENLSNANRTSDRAPLRFFYLVNDGLFSDPYERTKCFDYIISVIPYIDPSNSLALFKEALEKVNIHADEEFLYEISLFIDDPRILNDLVNELQHYQRSLFGNSKMQDGDIERLIALLSYKTLFPRDFELLQLDQGYVNALLKSRSVLIEKATEQNIHGINALLEKLHSDIASDDKLAIQNQIDKLEGKNLQFSRKTLAQLLSDMENVDSFFTSPPYRRGLNDSYLADILASPHFPLIQYLISRSWIDATHERFMSNHYSDSISVRDREFLMGIIQGRELDANYIIENPSAIVGRLDTDILAWSNAKNFSLLSYLIQHGPEKKLQAFFAGIRHDKSLEWIVAYTESDSFIPAIFNEIEDRLSSPIKAILESETIPLGRRRDFSHRLLALSQNTLNKEELIDAVLSFAQNDAAFLQVKAVSPMDIADGLLIIGYHPNNISAENVSKDLLAYVFKQGLFEPSAPFLDTITAAILDASPAIDNGYLVTRLYNIDDAYVRELVENNADKFVETLLENSQRNLTESSEAIAWLLNCSNLSESLAYAYIDALGVSTRIGDIEGIRNPLYQASLLDSNRVAATCENILSYFKLSNFAVNEHLAKFIMQNPFPEKLTMGFTEAFLGEESGFFTSIISCANISDDKLSEIIKVYRAQFNHFGIEGLSESRISLLIESGVIRPSSDNLIFVRNCAPNCSPLFAKTDIQAYLRLVLPSEQKEAPCQFSMQETLVIFEMTEVDERSKLLLLEAVPGPIELNLKYPHSLNAAIATKHFDPSEDLSKISELYLNGDRRLKRALAEAFVDQQLNNSAHNNTYLSMDMMADIAWRMRNERQEMLAFIAAQLKGRDPIPTRFEVRSVFERANLKEYVELIDGPSAIIPQSPADDALIESLSSLGMAGKQSGKADWQGQRRINSKGFSRS